MKKYTITVDGKAITKNVSPEKEQAFLRKYAKYNPTLVKQETSWWKGEEGWIPDELEFWKKKKSEESSPGKSQGTSQSQNNQQENTESSSETGSSDSQESNPKAYIVEDVLGKSKLTTFLGDAYRATSNMKIGEIIEASMLGIQQAKTLPSRLKYYSKGKNMSEEELAELVRKGREAEKYGPTDTMLSWDDEFNEVYANSGSAAEALVKATWRNPTSMLNYMSQSLSMQAYSAVQNWEKALAGGAAGVAARQGAIRVMPGASKLLGVGTSFIAGMMTATSATMETGLTTADLVRDKALDDGLDWSNMSDGDRMDFYRNVAEDEDLYNDITNKALKRGMTIGAIDGMTALVLPGTYAATRSAVAKSSASRFANVAAASTVAATETVGGLTSEYLGQKAAGQEYNVKEILLEGFADKTFTPYYLAKSATQKNPVYKINGQKLNGREFDRALTIMEDDTFIAADITIENSPTVNKEVQTRINGIKIDQTIDSRVSDLQDRAELIKLETRKRQLEQSNNTIELEQVEQNINDILARYEGSEVDVSVQDRKRAVALALEGKILDTYNKNLNFAKKHAHLYKVSVEELTTDQIKKEFGEQYSVADGFMDSDSRRIIINREVALQSGAVNVANHELLHAILEKTMADNPSQFANIRQQLSKVVGDQWQVVEQRRNANRSVYTDAYMQQYPDEWITLLSDAIASNQVVYKESIFKPLADLILPIIRRYTPFAKMKFNTGRDVFNFLKEYHNSVEKGKLSSSIVEATTGDTTGGIGGIRYSRSNLQGLLRRYGISKDSYDEKPDATRRAIKRIVDRTLSTRKDGQPIDMAEGDRAFFSSEFGQEVMPIVTAITKRLYDPISPNAKRNVTRDEYMNSLISMAGTIMSEYNFTQPVDKFMSNRLNLRANSLAEQLGIESAEISARQDRIDDRYAGEDTQMQLEDTTQPEAEFESQDISPQRRAEESKSIFEDKKKSQFVKKKLKFSDEVNDTIEETISETNYDANNKLYEDVKNDMVSQQNPTEASKNRVKPTGKLFPILKAIAQEVFGVDPKAIIAKPQNLTTPESTSARTKIAEDMKRLGVKDYLKSILTPYNFNPKSGKSIGINTGLLKALYADSDVRVPNIKGKALNVDNMSDTDIQGVFGINPDFTLMPNERRFDGPVKGLITQASVFAANQQARVAIDNQSAQVGVGKPAVMFSVSMKEGFYMDNNDLAKHWSNKTGIPVETLLSFTKYGKEQKATYDGFFTDDESTMQAKVRLAVEFIKRYPDLIDLFLRSGYGGMSRSTFGSEEFFMNLLEQVDLPARSKNEIKLIRKKYLTDKKQTVKNVNLTKQERAIESKKLDNLKEYFLAVQEFIKDSPEAAALFISFYQDGGSAGMGSTVRVSFPYTIYTINQRTRKPNYTDNMREEHNHPANQIHSALLHAAMEGNVADKFPGIRASMMQGSIKIEADNLINNGSKNIYGKKMKLKNAAPEIWFNEILPRIMSGDLKVEDGMGAVVRLAINGVNLNELMIDGKNQTIAEYFGVGIDIKNLTDKRIESLIPKQNHLVIQQMTGKVTKRKASNEIKKISKLKYKASKSQIKASLNSRKAVMNTFKQSVSGKVKGMSTFDFDDTLGYTKSGVRARVPNNDGQPKPNRKVIFLAGGAGSGKGNVIRKLNLEKQGFKIVNSDISLEWLKKNSGLPADMRNLTKEQRSTLGKLSYQARQIARRKMMKYQGNGGGVVVDGTGGSVRSMQKLVDEFKSKGYDVSMLFVDTSLDIALKRNRARAERSLLDTIVERNHAAVQGNKPTFQEMFGERFMEVNTDTLTMKSPMPTDLVVNMKDFVFSYENLRLDAEEFATQGDAILEQGGVFDFSEFNDVVEGTPGPLLEKARQRAEKFGTKDMFVLTARPQAAAPAIQEFLKSQGLNIPLKNITGLADSTGNAKAQWMLEKFAEGYNDMYFVDDALQNVEAVKKVLDQLDIKSDVVQARRRFSMSAGEGLNIILEESAGVDADVIISQAQAKREGKNKGWWRIFIPPSAEDFRGLLYRFLGEGRQGEEHMQYFKSTLLDPFAEGIRSWNIYKQEMVDEYTQLKRDLPEVAEALGLEVEAGFTVDDAIRVYLWDRHGFDIPGLDENTRDVLVEFVTDRPDVMAYADTLSDISRTQDGYIAPNDGWSLGSISTDLNDIVNKIGRKEFLSEYLFNVDSMFTPDNMNKVESLYGTEFREALENILYRMENGGNRRVSTDRNVNRMYTWINGSIGAIMFFNMRSALLQTLSTVNFINWHDNNIFKAAGAFANQPQFWSDFAMLFNSPQLKQRRKGIQIDVSASELSRAFRDGRGTPQSVISWLLEKGFTPTQVADSFAISFGGASMYRNRFETYLNEGFTEVDAHEKAMLDFQEVAESTQQSSREDLISQQQASPLGRLILAFQNVTMQYTRLTKKALSDLINDRGDMKTNISKILYYGAVQNIIFASLQSALAFIIFGGDQEEIEDKTKRTLNSALDSFLRGTGIYGAILSTVKNTVMQAQRQAKKGWGREDGRTILEAINLSPPIGSKLRKIYNAIKTDQYNKGAAEELGLRIENPTIHKWASIVEALTNIPTERLVRKANNLEEAITGNHLTWQRIALSLGWNTWSLGIKDEELEQAKKDAKGKNKKSKNKKPSGKRCTAIKKSGGRCKNNTRNKSGKCYAHQ